MPELPEVETIRRDLSRVLKGKVIKRVEIRKAKVVHSPARAFTTKLRDMGLTSIARRGKLLIFNLSDPEQFLLIHLKMTGQLIYIDDTHRIAGGHSWPLPTELPNNYSHLIFHFTDDSTLYFNDLRQFGYAKLVNTKEYHRILKMYGVEPLSKAFTVPVLQQAVHRQTFLKNALLDQTAIAGLGNIYVDESCFYAGVRPDRIANTLTPAEVKKLYRGCQAILKLALKHRGTTFNSYRDSRGKHGNFLKFLKVYGRAGERCVRCKQANIAKTKVAGRGTAYCPNCQK